MVEAEANVGGVAQLGEHLPCKQKVVGAIPITSTKGSLVQRLECLPYKQEVVGPNPTASTRVLRRY